MIEILVFAGLVVTGWEVGKKIYRMGRFILFLKLNRKETVSVCIIVSDPTESYSITNKMPWREAVKLSWQDKHIWQT